MNISDLVPLYVPVFVCWFLIWLTNAAERVGDSEEKKTTPDKECKKSIHVKNTDSAAYVSRAWNVSHFFGYR